MKGKGNHNISKTRKSRFNKSHHTTSNKIYLPYQFPSFLLILFTFRSIHQLDVSTTCYDFLISFPCLIKSPPLYISPSHTHTLSLFLSFSLSLPFSSLSLSFLSFSLTPSPSISTSQSLPLHLVSHCLSFSISISVLTNCS